MRPSLKVCCGGVALAAVLIAGAGWAVATGTSAQPVNAQIVANFAQFRRARTPADVLPSSIKPDARGCWGPGWPYGRDADPGSFGLASYYQLQCSPSVGAPPDRNLKGRQIIAGLQRDQSRAVRLPGRLGTVWLIPSGRWLCNLLRFGASFRARGKSGSVLSEGGISWALACEPISEVLVHPPLWPGGIWSAPSAPASGYLFALEPDPITHVTLAYSGGTQPTRLADNVLGACIGHGSSWLEQTGPTINGAIKTLLGGDSLNGRPERYRPKKCPHLP